MRITRDNFDAQQVHQSLIDGKVQHDEALRLLEEACHLISRLDEALDYAHKYAELTLKLEKRVHSPVDGETSNSDI
jgi:exonuclease VII small subunit